MEIEKIIYETTRGIYSVEDKLSIATIFVFCYKLSSISFAELLYCKDHSKFINGLNLKYSSYEVDFSIRFNDKNVKDCFYKTLEKVILKHDENGFYKALFEGDKFAIVISEILEYNFDAIKLKKFTEKLSVQLALEFK